MSASQLPALNAVAFQLIAELEAYEEDVQLLAADPHESDRYSRVAHHMDAMRAFAINFPTLGVAWAELMIRHFELLHGLWRRSIGQDDGPDPEVLLDQLRRAVRVLHQRCAHMLAAD